MDKQTLHLLNEVNRAIVKFRGIYSQWSNAHNISYNEMLVFYSIREKGFCTQKQICDSYLLPRQTINNVVTVLRNAGLLKISEQYSIGREKAFVLTEKGEQYAKSFMDSLNRTEVRAVELFGPEKLELLTALMLDYSRTLDQSLEEER